MREESDVAIGTWPMPEKPHVKMFEEKDRVLLEDLTDVFRKNGLEGRVVRVEFKCGTLIPPRLKGGCFRVCSLWPDDRLYCMWVCP